MRKFTALLTCLMVTGVAGSVFAQEVKNSQIIPQLDREKLPGRQVKVAAICIGFNGEHNAKLKMAIDQLETAGKNGVDIACLPEEFAGTVAEPIDGKLFGQKVQYVRHLPDTRASGGQAVQYGGSNRP